MNYQTEVVIYCLNWKDEIKAEARKRIDLSTHPENSDETNRTDTAKALESFAIDDVAYVVAGLPPGTEGNLMASIIGQVLGGVNWLEVADAFDG